MAVTMIARWSGDPADLTARYDQQCAAILRSFDANGIPGLIAHTCSVLDDGIVVVDAWETQESFAAFVGSDAFRRSLEDAGMEEPTIALGELHNVLRPEVAAPAA